MILFLTGTFFGFIVGTVIVSLCAFGSRDDETSQGRLFYSPPTQIECPACDGYGFIKSKNTLSPFHVNRVCERCEGTGNETREGWQ